MAAYVDQAYYGWSHEELPPQEDSREVSASEMLDHGSISFGRFAYEPLSWERRSVFTYNKCQEEFEKFKSPGLVAKKKAYFEEYYKRIRAMKALQESQQTEITLDYGGDSSFSSRTGGEETPVEDSMENGKDCSSSIEVQIRHSDLSTNKFEEHEHEEHIIYAHQMQHLDVDISGPESLKVSIEEPKQKDRDDLHDKVISMESTLDTNTETEIGSLETTPCPTNSREGDVELKLEHNVVPIKVMPDIRKYKDSILVSKLKEAPGPENNVSKLEHKVKRNTKKSSQGPKYQSQKTSEKSGHGVTSTKATADKVSINDKSTSTASKLEHKTKPNIQKTSQRSKCPIQKKSMKSGNGVSSSKATTDKVPRKYKSIFVSSQGPLTEVRSNITIPHPFSLGTDRRAAVSFGTREDAHKSIPKSSNQRSPSVVKGKCAIKVQGTSKHTVMTSSTKRRGLENKRTHDEKKKHEASDNKSTSLKVRGTNVITRNMESRRLESKRGYEENKKPAAVDCHSSSLKVRGASALGLMKARSLNLRSRDEKGKEEKLETSVPEFRRAETKVFTPSAATFRTNSRTLTPLDGEVRTEIKKMTPYWMSNSSCCTRKPQFGEQSLDGKKPRLERPRWR